MNAEDKTLIADYMGWAYHETDDGKWWNIIGKKGGNHLLDLNDAGLVVEKMVEKGDWRLFNLINHIRFLQTLNEDQLANLDELNQPEFTAWLFNPDNFFAALAAWLKEK